MNNAPAQLASLALALAVIASGPSGCRKQPAGNGADNVRPAARVEGKVNVTPPPVLPAPRPTAPLPADASCSTAECHAHYSNAAFVHDVGDPGECFVCHQADQGGHQFPLITPGNEGCMACHETVGDQPFTHLAVEASGCTSCHDPHASESRFMLTSGAGRALCVECHLLEERPYTHGPYAAGDCAACHEVHASDNAMLLRGGAVPNHCFRCHAETEHAITSAEYVHPPAAEQCTTCHDPHSSSQPHGLRKPMQETCFECHADLEQIVAGATAPHAAVFEAEQCANCHDAHASGSPKLLRDSQTNLCLECHGKTIVASDGRTIPNMAELLEGRAFLHGPVQSDNCTACHNVHGAGHARLLRSRFTDEFYASMDLGNYALCFECHDDQLATAERTEIATGFRDGDLNLHYLHVNRAKGRTCRSCHDIHGSDQPRHVAASVPFEGSGWRLPIDFSVTETGGTCASGCHEKSSYDREQPVLPPAGDASGDDQ